MRGPWKGRLALSARPRGGDWLQDEVSAWKEAGIATVFSLLIPQEEVDLDISDEARAASAVGLRFLSFPITDRQVPVSIRHLSKALIKLDAELDAGRDVLLHCRQGIGRTGLVAACLLVAKGFDPEAAVQQLSTARGLPVPETSEQREWIDHFAAAVGVLQHD